MWAGWVRHSGEKVTGRNGLPKMSRRRDVVRPRPFWTKKEICMAAH